MQRLIFKYQKICSNFLIAENNLYMCNVILKIDLASEILEQLNS